MGAAEKDGPNGAALTVLPAQKCRLARNVAWLGRLAQYGVLAASMASVLMMLRLPGYSLANLLAALWMTRAYWVAALAFLAVWAGGRLWRRMMLGPMPRAPEEPKLTGAARQADIGRAIAAWYMVGGFGLVAMLSLADRGPFALAVEGLRPLLGIATPFAGFVLGCATLVLSLVVLGRLPRLDGWPVLAAAQDMVRPAPVRRSRRRRPGRAG